MEIYKAVHRQIKELTSTLITVGICQDQNYPCIISCAGGVHKIEISGERNYSIALKNIKYKEKYEQIKSEKLYNIRMIDGLMILMLYTFCSSGLLKHTLNFFPSPYLENFQEFSEEYYNDEIYADMIDLNSVHIPIRFDYDSESGACIEHPISHLTIGQYKDCRIPVSSGISPYHFIRFLLQNFYNSAYKKNKEKIDRCNYNDIKFDETIYDKERTLIHINIPI